MTHPPHSPDPPRGAAGPPPGPGPAQGHGHGHGHGASLPLTLAFLGLVVYASLYPFEGWQWPTDATLASLLVPPWPHYHPRFDMAANVTGYMPLGALLFLSVVRGGGGRRAAAAVGLVAPCLLSWTMEFAQHFLPTRVPSLLDWVLNTTGGALGVAAAAWLEHSGLSGRWQGARARWLAPHSGTELTLLLLWPFGFLFPPAVPLGLGLSLDRLETAARDLLQDHPWGPSLSWLWSGLDAGPIPLAPPAEGLAAALGLLAPCLVAFAVLAPGRRRLAVLALCAVAGFGANTLSSALNFGPQHALAWVTDVVPAGLAVGLLAGLVVLPLRCRASAVLGLVTLAAGAWLVAPAPSDPYYAESLAAWEEGRFIHFHGLAQWVGWLWPLAAAAVLAVRLLRPDPPPVR